MPIAAKWLDVQPGERTALMLGFAFHFCVLASYYLVRPLRDALGLEGGADKLQWLFTATFVVMVLMVPVFGALASRLPATRFVPLIYRVIAASMLVFGVLIANRIAPVAVGRVFFVWISIYNLFIVSIFWSVLVDRFSSEQGRRLFGFIAAGGTLGTFIGPLLAATMATRLGPVALTVAAALLLEVAVRCYRALLSRTQSQSGSRLMEDRRMGGSMLAGITLITRSPYLLGLVLFMLLHTSAATLLYFEQGRIVAGSYADVASRTQFFAVVDLIVSALTLIFQLLLTAPLIRLVGVGGALVALPLATIVAFSAMALAPVPATVALAQGLRRAVEFAIVRPAREVLWTVVSREEKYKAKNVIETLVYRGGDAASGWLSVGLTALGAGFGLVALVIVPFAGLWGWLCLWLARHQEKQVESKKVEGSFHEPH
ncbi:MFS transporter [Pseudomonas sp. B14-6]|jgi:AAA family ATP:ADP antiporter|uniref:NTP/NDP exchange transporter n=1 Tax=unclassified Pseudomonas TaxID=196821 RepID=UPI00098AA87F|nr:MULTISPECIES: MFS transporter [unclassified Pseudomonas]MBA4362429.1 MFS transporter [Pseudomonas sp.]MBU0522426.1 MFS transporter [Gammaproteobacteria bacterium]MBU0819232.1 MFS transporter [Gammaproteobacteria bacterium]MBU0842593.1 MFS transporter [Gammaproteobacteria bacterium]MBU1840911.1 MFS transporter [Gammaproteobacteria bacterium]